MKTNTANRAISKSEVRLDEEAFNNMPGRLEVMNQLNAAFNFSAGAVTPVDLDRPYWQNDHDTLVLTIDPLELWRFGEDHNVLVMLSFAKFVQECGADEFDFIKVDGKRVVRIWWD